MSYTSPTTINTTKGMSEVLPYLSEVTNFWIGRMIMIAIFVIFIIGYMRTNNDDFFGGLAIASYVTFVIGLLFWVIGFVTGLDFGIILGITVISSVILLTQER